jgi:diguanylate cyclase (GGDEF)-like protein
MAGVPRLAAPLGAPTQPLDVRDPDVVAALVDCVAILGPDLRPRVTFDRLGIGFAQTTGPDAKADDWMHPDDVATVIDALEQARNAPNCDIEARTRVRNEFDGWHSMRLIFRNLFDHPDVQGIVVRASDETVGEREARFRALEEQLEFDATHDRLTGLGSRALLVEQLGAALARTRRGGRGVALLFIDLDGFKRVNDMLGHSAGDELLVQVAERLRGAVRDGDTCVRLGGDEFVVCCDMESVAHSVLLAERLLATLSDPYDVHGHEVLVGASIGIATAEGEDPVSVDQLLSNADVAAYRAKRHGRGRVEMFDDALRRTLAQGRRIARTVGALLDQPKLPLLCTPIVNFEDGAVVGFDGRVDWASAGLPADDELIARVVEEAGMSRALDLALVRTALAQVAEWSQAPPGPIVPGLSVTLTRAGAVSPLLAELVESMLARSRVPAALCWLGIPEAAVAHDLEAASRVVTELDALGLGVALRDFGSAISSLDQLRRLPTRSMTVAGPLVAAAHAGADEASTALLAAIVQYARALGRIVVALGVEDRAHAERLRELGCTFGSGAAFGPTVRPADVRQYFRA